MKQHETRTLLCIMTPMPIKATVITSSIRLYFVPHIWMDGESDGGMHRQEGD